jgi:hypothetical protein
MPVIPGFERQRQEDLECETSLSYRQDVIKIK